MLLGTITVLLSMLRASYGAGGVHLCYHTAFTNDAVLSLPLMMAHKQNRLCRRNILPLPLMVPHVQD